MNNIGLVVFCEEKEEKKANILESFLIKIKRLIETKLPESSIKKMDLYESLNMFLVRLPYALSELKDSGNFKISRLQKILLKACDDHSIEKCILPESVPDSININRCIKNPFSGKFIYTSLLVNILKVISDKKGVGIRHLSVTILQGSNYSLLYCYIKLLSPLAKFLTIITHEKELIQKRIEDIFDETGLSVRVTSDIASGLDDADVVINLTDLSELNLQKNIKCSAWVINYGNIGTDKIKFEGIVINGISIGLPKRIERIIEKDTYKFFSKTELSEIIILNKLNIGTNIIGNNADYTNMERISTQFGENGFTILINTLDR